MNYRITPTSIKYYFEFNESKIDDTEKLAKQIKRVAQYVDKKHELQSTKVEVYIAYTQEDWIRNKITLELTFYSKSELI